MNVPIIIPALRPGPPLKALVEQLSNTELRAIVIVDDGSGASSRDIFETCGRMPKVHVLRHATNRGKGAALKTAIRYVIDSLPDCVGVVTADADGQHHPEDILTVARLLEGNPDSLILGARQFDRDVPIRNRIANIIARLLARVILGQGLRDTQTGLRGIPAKLLPFLVELRSNGYEFELDMLIACKHHNCAILEQPIQTIYTIGNVSHFNPLRDSMKITFVFFRFSTLSLLTALLDNVVFFLAYHRIPSILASQAIGRLAAVLFNYSFARRAVFLSRQRHRDVLPRYILLVICSGAVSYGLIRLFTHTFGMKAIPAKISAELLLFIANFVLQRDFVFTKQNDNAATDWTRYYRTVPVTARLTRKYTSRVLIRALKRFGLRGNTSGVIVELGGANSCFLDRIVAELHPSTYHIVDRNEYGLNLLRQRVSASRVQLHYEDVLDMDLKLQADTVFSIGLIEHFDRAGTRKAILKHFDLLKPDGCVILSFPTPTWLYTWARRLTELLGMWNFPDERPLSRSEVLQDVQAEGEVVFEKTLWPLVFTQHLIVVRKPDGRVPDVTTKG